MRTYVFYAYKRRCDLLDKFAVGLRNDVVKDQKIRIRVGFLDLNRLDGEVWVIPVRHVALERR